MSVISKEISDTEKINLEKINPEQKKAIEHIDGPMMVIAGPGSGKTFVITRRIRYLIEHGIPPEEILVITFTRAAALEMEERFEGYTGESSDVTFGTFHAVYFHILKQSYDLDHTNIISAKEKKEYLKNVLSAHPEVVPDEEMLDYLLSEFSRLKNDGKDPEDLNSLDSLVEKEDFKNIFHEYSSLLKEEKKLDFDDMVAYTKELFEKRPDILDIWRERYRYILIDEFQDINPMQYEVIKLLTEPLRNIFIVGDDDQSIYGFRGSCPKLMLDFPSEYPELKMVCLKNNYRSTKGIVNDAVKLIAHNKNRYEKKLEAGRTGENDVIRLEFATKEEECSAVTGLIKKASGFMDYSDIAVIVRTNRQASVFAAKLSALKIPYKMREKTVSIFSTPAGRDIRAMLSFASGKRCRSDFLKFMNRPVRYIKRSDVPDSNDISLEKMAVSPGISTYSRRNIKKLAYDLKKISILPPFAAVNYIRKAMGYESFLIKEGKNKGISRDEVIAELDDLAQSAAPMDSFKQWNEWIELYEDELKNAVSDREKDGVNLITMHSSKGLEYRMVILPDLLEGVIPQKKADKQDELEEERRVFYVAVTRAKEKLVLCTLKKDTEKRIKPSRFLKELL